MNIKQQQIFTSICARIAQEGWVSAAFAGGAADAGLTRAQAHKVFPRGIADVAVSFRQMIDEDMLARIKGNRKFAALRVRDKVAFAVRARLESLERHREVMRRLLVWGAMPKQIRDSARHMWHVADIIWTAAGDVSTDYNHTTKRALLVAVMKATLSFWLNDESPGRAETWEFLDRRIDDVMRVGKGIGVARTVGAADMMDFARSALGKVMGGGSRFAA